MLVDGGEPARFDQVTTGRAAIFTAGRPVRLPDHRGGWRWESYAVNGTDVKGGAVEAADQAAGWLRASRRRCTGTPVNLTPIERVAGSVGSRRCGTNREAGPTPRVGRVANSWAAPEWSRPRVRAEAAASAGRPAATFRRGPVRRHAGGCP